MKRFFEMLAGFGPLGLLGLAFVESLGIPNPGGTDVALVALAAARPEQAALCGLYAVLGSVAGSAIFFEIMRKGGEAFLARRAQSPRAMRFREWYQRYGLVTVFVSALVPIPFLPFKVFAACAGALGVSRRRFLTVLTAARAPRYGALAYLGTQLGPDSWPWVRGHVWHLTGISVVLCLILFAVAHWLDRSREPGRAPHALQ